MIIYVINGSVKIIAIVAVLPLFLLEFFSTYQWICFTDSSDYCNEGAPPSTLQTQRIKITLTYGFISVILGTCFKIDKTLKELYFKYRGMYLKQKV